MIRERWLELLVVLVIIAILIGMVWATIREKEEKKDTLSNVLRQLINRYSWEEVHEAVHGLKPAASRFEYEDITIFAPIY